MGTALTISTAGSRQAKDTSAASLRVITNLSITAQQARADETLSLIRRGDDRGVFVLLDSRTPSRVLSAFPEGVRIRRVGLAQAVAETAAFLAESPPSP